MTVGIEAMVLATFRKDRLKSNAQSTLQSTQKHNALASPSSRLVGVGYIPPQSNVILRTLGCPYLPTDVYAARQHIVPYRALNNLK